MQGEKGKALIPWEGDVSPPGQEPLTSPFAPKPPLSSIPGSPPRDPNILALLLSPPSALPVISVGWRCHPQLPSFLCCPPHLTPGLSSPAQTAMEVEGAREAEEQRGRRLSDFYDIHQEIGRCGARRGCGAEEPKGAWV